MILHFRALAFVLENKFPIQYGTSMACAIGPIVNPLQNGETQHENIVLQCMHWSFEQSNMKGNHAWIEFLVGTYLSSSPTHHFSFQQIAICMGFGFTLATCATNLQHIKETLGWIQF
jgi:hypothetical protein